MLQQRSTDEVKLNTKQRHHYVKHSTDGSYVLYQVDDSLW